MKHVGWWGKEQTQLKGYCRSPGEGSWRPGWGDMVEMVIQREVYHRPGSLQGLWK